MEFGADIQRINSDDFGDPLTLHPVPPGQNYYLSSKIALNLKIVWHRG